MVAHTCNNVVCWLTPVTVRHAGSPLEQQWLEAVAVDFEFHVIWGYLRNLKLYLGHYGILSQKNQPTNPIKSPTVSLWT